jgi:hypothetical protein
MNRIFVVIFIIVIFVFGGLLYIYNPEPTRYKNPNEPEPVFCTADARLCPDGSYVGRTGSKCEFVCPEATSTPVFEDGTVLPE